MVEQSFKERVRLKLMDCAVLYYELLVQKDYLIFSRNFRYQKYYIVSAFEDNFLHLTGVHTNLKAKNFFEKCYQKTLEDGDFEINLIKIGFLVLSLLQIKFVQLVLQRRN